jgi:flagellar hook-basal body complex protein FliE
VTEPFAAIQGISSNINPVSTTIDAGKSLFAEKTEDGSKFENLFTNYMNNANQTLNKARELGDKVATGDLKSIHKLSVAGMKAEIMLKLTTQIAAKLSSTCTTLFQMQM